jgi:hypothetical protein
MKAHNLLADDRNGTKRLTPVIHESSGACVENRFGVAAGFKKNCTQAMNAKASVGTREHLGLRRPSAALDASKAPEDWRSPKPGGNSNGSGKWSIATKLFGTSRFAAWL